MKKERFGEILDARKILGGAHGIKFKRIWFYGRYKKEFWDKSGRFLRAGGVEKSHEGSGGSQDGNLGEFGGLGTRFGGDFEDFGAAGSLAEAAGEIRALPELNFREIWIFERPGGHRLEFRGFEGARGREFGAFWAEFEAFWALSALKAALRHQNGGLRGP